MVQVVPFSRNSREHVTAFLFSAFLQLLGCHSMMQQKERCLTSVIRPTFMKINERAMTARIRAESLLATVAGYWKSAILDNITTALGLLFANIGIG